MIQGPFKGGAVVLHALIGPDGLVKQLTVITGPEELRAPCLEAVRKWTFRPYLLYGEAVAVDTTISLNID